MLHLKVQTALDGGGFHARVSGMHAQGPGGHHGPASPEVDVEEFVDSYLVNPTANIHLHQF